MNFFIKKESGMSLVEVVIAAAVFLLISSVLISTNLTYYKTSDTNLKSIKAVYLAEEGVEAVNFLANDWENMGLADTDYYLSWNGMAWVATTTPNLVDQVYRRTFSFESVNRDSNNDIVSSSGTLDPDTRKVTVEITWSDTAGQNIKSLSSYIFNPNKND